VSGPLEWSLFSGPLPIVLLIGAAAAGGFLLFRSDRHWRTRVLPAVAVGSVLVTLGLAWVVNSVWRPFPDALPLSIWAWIGVIVAAAALAVAHVVSARWWKKAIAVVAAVSILAAGANQINRFYGYYPSAAALLELPLPHQLPLPPIQHGGGRAGSGSPASAPTKVWTAPPNMPSAGAVSEVNIPGVRSGFPARPGWVYLPPAYLTANRPALPVLVLITAQPGTTRGWIDAGRVITIMDAFAADHAGLAPMVVMPDPLGSTLANPLCADTSLGKADTYLAKDVPAWIAAHLQVDPNTAHWAVGGFSFGGTCSLQLAVNHPRLFPTFLDISGQNAPTLGSPQLTVDRAFRGDARAFATINPLDILAAAHRGYGRLLCGCRAPFTGVAGTLVVGSLDRVFYSQQRQVQVAAVGAGMSIRWLEMPGGHNWHVAAAALKQVLPWLGRRMGLTR